MITFVSENQRVWDKLVALFLLSYGSSHYKSTVYASAIVLREWEMKLPIDFMFKNPPYWDKNEWSFP